MNLMCTDSIKLRLKQFRKIKNLKCFGTITENNHILNPNQKKYILQSFSIQSRKTSNMFDTEERALKTIVNYKDSEIGYQNNQYLETPRYIKYNPEKTQTEQMNEGSIIRARVLSKVNTQLQNISSMNFNSLGKLLPIFMIIFILYVSYSLIKWYNKDSIVDFTTQFIITPQIWMFKKSNPIYLDQLMTENNHRFASLSNFRVNTLTMSNYTTFLSKEGNQKIQNVLKELKQRKDKGDKAVKDQFYSIQKRLILFSILFERGGVIIDGSLTLTENFDWIRQIQSNIYVNRGNPDAQPQVVGFYSPLYSSNIKKQNKSLEEGMELVDRYMVLIPAMQSYFVAAKVGAEYIGKVLDEMIAILTFPESIGQDIRDNKYEYYNLDGKDIYNQYLFLAGQRLLQDKQLELDSKNTNKDIRNFAIDYYGLYLINCFYSPEKISVIYQRASMDSERKIQSIAKYDLSEYEASVGPMRYLQITTIFNKLNDYLTRIRDNKLEKQIMIGSYLQKMYFPDITQPFLFNNPQKWVANPNAPRWENLSKIIWIYYDTSKNEAPFQTAVFIQNLKKVGSSSGFEVVFINNGNLADYLDAAILQKIDYSINNAKITTYPQTKPDLVRLALLYQHGGLYLDASVLAIQSFDWLVNIAQLPSQYIFNRFEDLPSAVLFWNPKDGGFFEWEVDQVANTKAVWRLSIENSIIAAQKKSKFIKKWFDLFSSLLLKTPAEIMKVLDQCNITSFKWITQKKQYLLAMDSAKCVIGQKQVQIMKQKQSEWKNGVAYYRLWSFCSYYGPLKIRGNMNLANIDRWKDNPFFTRYSQEYVQGLIGKIHFAVKFIKDSRHIIPTFIKKNFGRLEEESHSQSLFRKYFYNANDGRFQKINETQIVWIKNNK